MSSHPQPFVELGAIAVAAVVRQNNFNFNLGMRAATHNRLCNWVLLLAAVVAKTTLIAAWACEQPLTTHDSLSS